MTARNHPAWPAIYRRRKALGANLLNGGLPPGVPNVFRDAIALWDTRFKPCTSTSLDPLIDIRGEHDLHLGSIRSPYIGHGKLHLPGLAGSYASSPDSAALDITGDIDLRIWLSVDDWTPALHSTLLGKFDSPSDEKSYWLRLSPTGNLELVWSTDGSATLSGASTAPVGLTDGEGQWIRVTLNVDNGAAASELEFFLGGGDAVPTWVQLGTTVSAGGVTSIYAGTAPLEVGSVNIGVGSLLAGKVYRTQVFDGIDGTKVFDANFSQPDYTSSFTDLFGAVVTIHQNGDDTNDPVWLPNCNKSFLWLPGTVGNYASAPDEAALDITGDLDLRFWVAADDWTPGALQYVGAKWNAPPNRSYAASIDTNGLLRLQISSDGSAVSLDSSSSIAPTVANKEGLWIRYVLDIDNGSGGSDVLFYTGGSEATPNWVQLGTTQVETLIASINSGASPFFIGGINAAGSFVGKTYRVQICDGIDGTLVFDADFTNKLAWSSAELKILEAETGQIVTVNRSATGYKSVVVYDRSVYAFAIDDYMEADDHADLNFDETEDFTLVAVWRGYGDLRTQQIMAKRSGLSGYAIDSASTGDRRHSAFIGDGTDFASATLASDYADGVLDSGIALLERTVSLRIYRDGLTGSQPTIGAVDSLSSSQTLKVGAFGPSPSNFADMEFVGGALFRKALSDGEIAAVVAYFEQVVAGTLVGSGFDDGFDNGFG